MNNQLAEAEKLLRVVLSDNPSNPQALYLYVQVGIKGKAYAQILPILEKCISIIPTNPEPLLQLAQVQSELNLYKASEKTYLSLIEKFPNWTAGLFNFAGFLQSFGNKDKAKELLQKVIKLSPEHCGAYLALSGLMHFESESPLINTMSQLLDKLKHSNENSDHQQMLLHYALGKAKAETEQYQLAFEHWTYANQFQLNQCRFTVAQMTPFFEQIKAVFSNSTYAISKLKNNQQPTPIFIVGLPRTGSTLLEQMLSSHSEIGSAGEVDYVAQTIAGGLYKLTGAHYPAQVDQLTHEQWLELGDQYLKQLQTHSPNSRFIIDKLPANFQSIGIIKRAIPNAVVIHLSREVQAVGLSVFRNYFQSNEPYFCDLSEFAKYRQQYLKVMLVWQKLYKDSLIELSYEQLVKEPEKSLSRILEDCGLVLEADCLSFYEHNRPVRTLSEQQVKQPIYQKSLQDWQHYQQWLTPFFSHNADGGGD